MLKRTIIALALLALLPGAALAAEEVFMLDKNVESMKKAGMGPVRFPHTLHKNAYKCSECHPKIFEAKRGANDITMKLNMNKQFCGSPNCHNSPKAFPLFHCNKCHTKMK